MYKCYREMFRGLIKAVIRQGNSEKAVAVIHEILPRPGKTALVSVLAVILNAV